MIITIGSLLEKYNNYQDPHGKIKRDVNNAIVFPVVRGIYETNKDTPGLLLASVIYNPSYLSFEYAMSYYGLIPERAVVYTNATYNKKRSKLYRTSFGNYTYRDIPKAAYPLGIEISTQDGYVVFMASREKALCDFLYIQKPVRSIKELRYILFTDLRVDESQFKDLDKEKLLELIPKYKSNNLNALKKMISKECV